MSFTYDAGTGTPGYGGYIGFPSLVICDGTFRPIAVPPLVQTAPLRVALQSLPRGGAFASPIRFDSWAFEIGAFLDAGTADDVQAAIDYLRGKINLYQGAMTVTFNAKGWAATRQMTLRLAGQVNVEDPDIVRKKVRRRTFTVPVLAEDPRMYATSQTTTTVTTSTAVTNAGTAVAPFVTRFEGPQTNPKIDGPGTAGTNRIRLGRTLAGGEWVEVNTADGTAVDNTGANAYGDITAFTADVLNSGASNWTKSNDAGAGATKVIFRSAWG